MASFIKEWLFVLASVDPLLKGVDANLILQHIEETYGLNSFESSFIIGEY